MENKLKKHFPMIRDREELLEIIRSNETLKSNFESWEEEKRQEFLDFCTGVRGIKILYDPFVKEAMNPEYDPERLEQLLSLFLNRKVKIKQILPNDSTRIADEGALVVTDIIVELEDGSIANVEIQKIGYLFPGQRSACYSADMLLRQYKRVRNQQKKKFSYYQIKNVFLIVLYEKSPKEFKKYPQEYMHHSKQVFNTGLELELLQEYVMIPLDIFRETMQNKPIETLLEAWLIFLSSDNPERIIELITKYPRFKPLYETLYRMCQNVEGVMGFFSEELKIMDRNLTTYMMEEQQKELEESKRLLEEIQKEVEKNQKELEESRKELEESQKELEKSQKEKIRLVAEKDAEIEMLRKQLERYQK